MGFQCEIRKLFAFIYYAQLENGIVEHEYDHVFIGQFDGSPNPNPNEIDDWKWIDLPALKIEMETSPEVFTYWFKLSLDKVCGHFWPQSASSSLETLSVSR